VRAITHRVRALRRSHKILLVIALIVLCFVTRAGLHRVADARLVSNVEEALEKRLAADPELKAQFGAFLELQGHGHDRPEYFWMLVERVTFSRTARFEHDSIVVGVTIPCGRSIWHDLSNVHFGPFEIQEKDYVYFMDLWVGLEKKRITVFP
jgi:hypothetical protein